jgi:hypothetical protein
MDMDADNEAWLVEDAGHAAIEKKAERGHDALSPIERLIYCLWVADYGMRNAGDLSTAEDLYPPFQTEGRRIAEELSLPRTLSAFRLSRPDLERTYFEIFDRVCEELRRATA